MSRRTVAVLIVLAMVGTVAFALAGCARKPAGPTKVRIGTVPTEDALPLFVAVEKGYFKKKGLDVTIETFPSAQERDAALQAGKIDGFMGDLLAAAMLENGGVDVSVVSIMMGATPQEGRFAILVPGNSPIKGIAQLRNVPVAISKDTVIEYVTDELLKEYGLKGSEIKKVEVKKIPIRQEMLVAGQLQAATLPDPFAAVAEKRGARVIVDDTRGANLSQTVLLFRKDFVDKDGEVVTAFLEAQNEGVKAIKDNPAAFQPLLIQKARIPTIIARTYLVGKYPAVQVPKKADVDRVLKWMSAKKLIKGDVTYERVVDQEVQPK
ncbi:MAG: MetQ/NlpA family ABC transporter substrate-binding protein [Actinobacteria bacterium]|nr:MetQ/NlpA family ABC transporter substrate-binding protein [Actinomycetota bacterium]